jgi:hypothetical protein
MQNGSQASWARYQSNIGQSIRDDGLYRIFKIEWSSDSISEPTEKDSPVAANEEPENLTFGELRRAHMSTEQLKFGLFFPKTKIQMTMQKSILVERYGDSLTFPTTYGRRDWVQWIDQLWMSEW